MDIWVCVCVCLKCRIYSVIQCQGPLKSMNAECIKETVAQQHVIKLLCVCVCVGFLHLAVSSNLYDQGNVCLTN